MSHEPETVPWRIDDASAHRIAEFMHAFAHPVRVQILGLLRRGPMNVGELTVQLNVEQSAASHQLRLLRDLGLVTTSRSGRHIYYDVHDEHVVEMMDQALHHVAHRALGKTRSRSMQTASVTKASRAIRHDGTMRAAYMQVGPSSSSGPLI